MPRPPGHSTRRLVRRLAPVLCLLAVQGCAGLRDPGPAPTSEPGLARGVVYEDRDRDGVRDPGERGLAGVRVSNGLDIVTTNRQGRYALPVDRDSILFVIKPSGMMTPIDERRIPRFYYIHKPDGSPDHHEYPGVPSTGELPPSVDFGLYERPEPGPFRVILLGDPQPYNAHQVDLLGQDVLEELHGKDVAFGVSLGDLVGDDLSLFDPLTRSIGLVDTPWYSVLGNHDLNFDALHDRYSDETFERVFGPATYAFEYGGVHFVVLDNVIFHPANEERGPRYDGGLLPRHLAFLERYLEGVPDDELVVLLLHIPLVGEGAYMAHQRPQLFEILADHPHTLSVSAHTHIQGHHFLGEDDGNTGPEHHHWNNGTASGNWWMGLRDELGIPHATMRDGTPNGYSIATFDGHDYSIRYKAARRPADYQMNIYAPVHVPLASAEDVVVRVNVFAGSERSRVEMRLVPLDPARATEWMAMERSVEVDPSYVKLREEDAELRPERRPLPGPEKNTHLWSAPLPSGLESGSHWIEVRTTDMFGQQDDARRIVHLE